MLARRLALLLLATALLVAACGRGAPSPDASAATAGPAATEAPGGVSEPTATPVGAAPATDEPLPSEEPPASDDPAATEGPLPSPPPSTGTAGTATPTPGGDAGAAACSGSDANRDFFARFARAVDWTVLCGVLPRGWFVGAGKYRLANGGWLEIGYKGPGGATLQLRQGASCVTNGGCHPSGTDLGDAALGPLSGTLYASGAGFAIVVAPGDNPAWVLETSGLDQDATEQLAAGLAVVEG